MKMANSDTYRIVEAMKARGNQPGLIREWFDGMKVWAEANKGADASALRLWLDYAKPRTIYTAAELAALWPSFKIALGMETRLMAPPSANRLANELDFHGLPRLQNNGGLELRNYFIVERLHYWRERKLTDGEFHDLLNQ